MSAQAALTVVPSLQQPVESKIDVKKDHKELRAKMRTATNDGVEELEKNIGEMITRDLNLSLEAGELLAQKINNAPGMIFSQVQVVVEVGNGKYFGLGQTLAIALTKMPNLKLKDLKVVTLKWEDTEIADLFKEVRSLKILFVTAAKTPELAKKMQASVDNLRSKVSAGIDVVGICSLVCLDESKYEHIETPSNGSKKNSAPRNIEGLTITE